MRRKIVIYSTIIIILCLLTCMLTLYNRNRIDGVLHLNKNSITKIIIVDSRSINNYKTIENKKDIDEFMAFMDSDIIRKENIPQNSNGWDYTVKFFNNEKELANFIVANDLVINGKQYEIVKGDFTLKNIPDFIK